MMNRYIRIGLLAAMVAAPIAGNRSTLGATYHVAPRGNDTHPGTEAQPWATLRKAAASVQPGDTVRIRAGDYYEPSGWNVRRAGTADKPITYQAHGDGEVRITPSSVLPAGAWTHVKGSVYSTQVKRRPAYIFQNAYPLHPPGDRGKIHAVDDMFPNSFSVDGQTLYVWLEDGSHPKDSVIRVTSAHVVELRDCHFTIFDGLTVEYGFNGFKDQGKATHHVTYRNCTIRSIGSQGIQPVPQDSVIERNLFQKIGSNKYLHGIYNSKPGLIVRHNVFEEIAGAAIHQFHEGSPAGGHCEFSGNIFRKPRPMTLRPDARGRSPYYVEIIAWGEGHHRIYDNVFHGEGKRGGISLNSVDNQVYRNTFVGSAYGIQFHAGKTGNQVTHNIFQDATTTFLIWPAQALPQTLDRNVYYNTAAPPRWQRDGVTYQTFSAYQQAADETHSRYEDPHLVGATGTGLPSGSPAALGRVTERDAAGGAALRVHPTNPRYFTDGTRSPDGSPKAVYLTGSHTWLNLQDGNIPAGLPPFDYDAYLDFLQEYHHNFIRLWAWESSAWVRANSERVTISPLPFARTGPVNCGEGVPPLRVAGILPALRGRDALDTKEQGQDALATALDGKPKFDVTKFDPAYFDRLRERVIAARERGFYVGIMLFQGFSVARKDKRRTDTPWTGHPLHAANNVNGLDGDSNGDGEGYEVHTLGDPAITRVQEAYVRKVIDTVNDLDNVLYEISNESHGGSTAWQYHMIDFIRRYEQTKPRQHPVWMSFCWDGVAGPGTMADLLASSAEAVSPPGNDKGHPFPKRYLEDPPADDAKVVIADTDHLWGVGGNRAWVWKSFLRGLQPIFMDTYRHSPFIPAGELDPQWQDVRRAMGVTRRLAEQINLAALTPHPELVSTAYCLAHPGREYLIYLPDGGEVTVDLSAAKGTLAVEWLNPRSGAATNGGLTEGGAKRSLRPPFAADAVLHLRAHEGDL